MGKKSRRANVLKEESRVLALDDIKALTNKKVGFEDELKESKDRTKCSYNSWQEDVKKVKSYENAVENIEKELRTGIFNLVLASDSVKVSGLLLNSGVLACLAVDGVPCGTTLDLHELVNGLSRNRLRISIDKIPLEELEACTSCEKRFNCLTTTRS